MNHDSFLVPPGKKFRLQDSDPAYTGKFKEKEDAASKLADDIRAMAELQDVLYAQREYSLLLVFQAMDAAGKDSAIKHVMSGINPQGCQVVSFKAPSPEELDHDYLWRCVRELPERGKIGIFNRSYYEEVLVVRVHPEILKGQRIPPDVMPKDVWTARYRQINNFEQYLTENGVVVLKFFLHVSKKEQKKRFLERIETPEKIWKFSAADVKERGHWDEYMKAYEEMFRHTSTAAAPWYVIPADRKWFTRTAVADIIVARMRSLKLRYPTPAATHLSGLREAKAFLENEK
jgi:PPK2 family polyphosphate:nucleotide phosphotransferase